MLAKCPQHSILGRTRWPCGVEMPISVANTWRRAGVSQGVARRLAWNAFLLPRPVANDEASLDQHDNSRQLTATNNPCRIATLIALAKIGLGSPAPSSG